MHSEYYLDDHRRTGTRLNLKVKGLMGDLLKRRHLASTDRVSRSYLLESNLPCDFGVFQAQKTTRGVGQS